MHGENAADAGLTAEQEICHKMEDVIDRLIAKITGKISRLRFLAYDSWFGFLLNIQNIVYRNFEDGKLQEKYSGLAKISPGNINRPKLFRDYRMLINKRIKIDFLGPTFATDLLTIIILYGEDVFPNLKIELELTNGIQASNCERTSLTQ